MELTLLLDWVFAIIDVWVHSTPRLLWRTRCLAETTIYSQHKQLTEVHRQGAGLGRMKGGTARSLFVVLDYTNERADEGLVVRRTRIGSVVRS